MQENIMKVTGMLHFLSSNRP